MTVAIVIGTHGASAEQLLRSTEMIIGEQSNVGFIDFMPGENADTLVDKLNEEAQQLDTSEGLLFLVDLFGGSPFNAASRIVIEDENADVVTGVSIPMLLETFSMRPSQTLVELVQTAITSGQFGIKSLKESLSGAAEEENEEEL
ncbi:MULTISPECIES: mannose/fructose/sorbose PTS transporter subunit IIA [Brochothrix]|uniref:Fructose-specific PTS enzymes: IIA component n=1 Tax=Brochothrix thermosphacta TaxID=2756 RepID=A0A2X0QKG5_BROTH|nr:MULTISPECIES: mannose/fructose/sorbose PTS transporter subunit IIA [Brochothrix]SLN05848.1 PTS system, mannose-specific IIA component / PTS system, mannose-specific IIB component [Brachybacterium faecium]ANZ95446.1 PTS mannose transporter subunit IID [Brochothrix thermosphacta]EUJ38800.1 sugar phosphotransferasesystem component IIA [Brochothrix thermosphacta DSM 20171 = FSL F6-1036]MBR5527040.1 PTS mannose transporter subunit IID [Brochothrix sp.]ODJ51218.1 PTS mannose transporter subunit I